LDVDCSYIIDILIVAKYCRIYHAYYWSKILSKPIC